MAHPTRNPWRTEGWDSHRGDAVHPSRYAKSHPGTYETVGSQSLVSTVGGRNKKANSQMPKPPFKYAAPAPATMIALKLRLFGSLNKEHSEM